MHPSVNRLVVGVGKDKVGEEVWNDKNERASNAEHWRRQKATIRVQVDDGGGRAQRGTPLLGTWGSGRCLSKRSGRGQTDCSFVSRCRRLNSNKQSI